MKALFVVALMTLGTVFSVSASGNNAMLVKERANHISDQMIRELRLNNYQANACREINADVISKIAAIESEFAGNQEAIDQKTKSVLAERDLKLEGVLSTVQYNKYFGKRNDFNKADKAFVATVDTKGSGNENAANQTDATASSSLN